MHIVRNKAAIMRKKYKIMRYKVANEEKVVMWDVTLQETVTIMKQKALIVR